jgi:hypothetical protein
MIAHRRHFMVAGLRAVIVILHKPTNDDHENCEITQRVQTRQLTLQE